MNLKFKIGKQPCTFSNWTAFEDSGYLMKVQLLPAICLITQRMLM